MTTSPMLKAAVVLAMACLASASVWAADTDGDGLSDKHEEILGSDPKAPDTFTVIAKDGVESEAARAKPTYDPTKDFTTIEFCHAGGDRYLWRATFAAAPRPKDTVLHYYVDADSNGDTGRKGQANAHSTGTEYMVTLNAGGSYATCYAADGSLIDSDQIVQAQAAGGIIVTVPDRGLVIAELAD